MSVSILHRDHAPKCCRGCDYLDCEAEEGHEMYCYCMRNIWLPFKKQSCTKFAPWGTYARAALEQTK